MSNKQHSPISQDEPMTYQILIKGHLNHDWEDWFDNVSIVQTEDGKTLLICVVRDQSALHGLLRHIRDLGVHLISVVRVESGSSED